jgi:hypothetical protein
MGKILGAHEKKHFCRGCHAHTQANTVARHSEEGIAALTDCAKCHPGGRGEGGD